MGTFWIVVWCIIIVALFVIVAIVLGSKTGQPEQKYFTELDQPTQDQLYHTPVRYEDESRRTWRQNGYVHDVKPHANDDDADVELLWYSGDPDLNKKKGKSETRVEHLKMKKAEVQTRQLKKGDVVTIRVDPEHDEVKISD